MKNIFQRLLNLKIYIKKFSLFLYYIYVISKMSINSKIWNLFIKNFFTVKNWSCTDCRLSYAYKNYNTNPSIHLLKESSWLLLVYHSKLYFFELGSQRHPRKWILRHYCEESSVAALYSLMLNTKMSPKETAIEIMPSISTRRVQYCQTNYTSFDLTYEGYSETNISKFRKNRKMHIFEKMFYKLSK